MEMARKEEEKFEWPDVSAYYSGPTKEEWEHEPDAEVVPGWVMAIVAFAILVLFILMVHVQQLLPLLN
jgi:hypothetical protein